MIQRLTKRLWSLLVFFSTVVQANNLTITNARISAKNTINDTYTITFDLRWENNWREGDNWDACWIVVKFFHNGEWQHAHLSLTGHSAGSIDAINDSANIQLGLVDERLSHSASNPAVGAFFYRSPTATTSGGATFNTIGAELIWDYASNGLSDSDTALIAVLGTEMVYVASGAFSAGFFLALQPSITNFYEPIRETISPQGGAYGTWHFEVLNENAVTLSTAVAEGNVYASDYWGSTGVLPADYPKGFNAFYCMKYEGSQSQYVTFLNLLPTAMRETRYPNKYGQHRHGITQSGFQYSTDLPYVACNYVSWADASAYLDWMGLRPMTELEFEKLCDPMGQSRDGFLSDASELPWGTGLCQNFSYCYQYPLRAITPNSIANAGGANEYSYYSGSGKPNLNARRTHNQYGDLNQGPLRVGSFATQSNLIDSAGATPSGILDIGGNLSEFTIGITNDGRGFEPIHGDGQLSIAGPIPGSVSGDANVSTWPSSAAEGTGRRGGSWADNSYYAVEFDRRKQTSSSTRESNNGIRGVRSEPSTSAQ